MHYMQDSKEKETEADNDDNINEDKESIGLTMNRALDMKKDQGQWWSFICNHRRQMAGVRN